MRRGKGGARVATAGPEAEGPSDVPPMASRGRPMGGGDPTGLLYQGVVGMKSASLERSNCERNARLIDEIAQEHRLGGIIRWVKRLFKRAESSDEHERMAVFLVAFDRLVRRQRRVALVTMLRRGSDGRKKSFSPQRIRSWRPPRTEKPAILVPENGSTCGAGFECPGTGDCSRTNLANTSGDGHGTIFVAWDSSDPRSYPQAVASALAPATNGRS